MLILILVVGIALFVGGWIYDTNHSWSMGGVGMMVLGAIISVVVGVGILAIAIGLTEINATPKQIEVLREQNQKIENQINSIVENYLTHESETYEKLTPDNAETFAIAYPQLSSNETVQKQMSLYIENNAKITDLKLGMCYKSVYEWWLYFGGGE